VASLKSVGTLNMLLEKLPSGKHWLEHQYWNGKPPTCQNWQEVNAFLLRRHEQWKHTVGFVVV
jgi:hypothetical protein